MTPRTTAMAQSSGQFFEVRFHFRTAVAVGDNGLLPPLDSLLASVIARREGRLSPPSRVEPAPINLPLDEIRPGLYAASLIWPTHIATDGSQEYRRIHIEPSFLDRTIIQNTNIPKTFANPSSGPLVTKQRQRQALIVQEAVAYGRGDALAVKDLLNDITQVGGFRGIGFGLLKEPPAPHRMSYDRSLVDPKEGKLLRIVPLRLAEDLGLDPDDERLAAYVGVASVRPPLWFKAWHEECLIPLPLNVRGKKVRAGYDAGS